MPSETVVELLASQGVEVSVDDFEHAGVKGMKWGVRKERKRLAKEINSEAPRWMPKVKVRDLALPPKERAELMRKGGRHMRYVIPSKHLNAAEKQYRLDKSNRDQKAIYDRLREKYSNFPEYKPVKADDFLGQIILGEVTLQIPKK